LPVVVIHKGKREKPRETKAAHRLEETIRECDDYDDLFRRINVHTRSKKRNETQCQWDGGGNHVVVAVMELKLISLYYLGIIGCLRTILRGDSDDFCLKPEMFSG